jgi:hypothetical protein
MLGENRHPSRGARSLPPREVQGKPALVRVEPGAEAHLEVLFASVVEGGQRAAVTEGAPDSVGGTERNV